MSKRKPQNNKSFQDGLASLTNSLANTRNAGNTNQILSTRLTDAEMNEIFKTGLGNKIVRIKNDTAYKEGVKFEKESDQTFFDENLKRLVRDASKWLLAFGRGVIAIVEPNKDVKDPLVGTVNKNTVLLQVFDGSIVTAQSHNRDLKSERYQKPDFYQIRGHSFHHSRIIDFTYIKPIETDLPTYNFGGISEFELIHQQLINDGVVERAAPTILDKNASLFYSVKGFKNALQTGKEKDMLKYFSLLEDHRSVYGAGLLDSEDSVDVVNQTLTNLSETDNITLRRLAMVTGIPLAVLVGENVQGLNANGDNETDIFNSTITSLQNNYYLDPINELNEKLGLGKATFNQPDQMSPEEKAALDKTLLENALILEQLGQDSDAYLADNGFEISDNPEGFGEDDEEVKEV